jgi:superkiller protein 3
MNLDLAPPAEPSMSVPLSFDDNLDLAEPSKGNIPALELPDDPGLGSGPGDRFESMDLPGAGDDDGGVVQFQKPSASAAPRTKAAALDLSPVSDSLELDDDGPAEIVQKKVTVHDADLDVAKDKKKSKKSVSAKEKKGMSPKLQRIIALAVLGVVALGAGGFFMYKRWQGQKAASKEVGQSVSKARKLLRSDAAGHWDKAAKAAEAALKNDDGLEEPRGIAAQAYLAAFLDEGVDMKTRTSRGIKHVTKITDKNFSGADAEKAKALKLIIDGNAQRAVDRLKDVLKKKKTDQDALLYLGWAHASLHDHKAAAEAFAKALKNAPNRKTPALFGLAEAQLALGQVKEARESFRQVIDRNKDHVGALVGSAQAAEVGNFTERENQYLAILRRKDIEKADPRAVSRAWALAGDEALKAGRVDVAKTRYDEATKIFASNLEAKVGKAKASLRQGRLDAAREVLLDVLNEDPAHLDANLTFAEAAARQDKLDEATTKVESLLSRDPPIQNPTDLARVYTVQGQILSADKTRLNEAIEAYEQARTHAGEDNVQPTVALSLLLSANDRRAEGLKLLEPLEAKAEGDPVLATTLGVAFLAADDPLKAEGWFRKALTERPSDIEAHYQLGLSLLAQDKKDDAIDIMKKAYAIEQREDIGLRLAVVFESMDGHDDDAGAMYDTLLKADNVSINVTSRAGRFYSRTGNLEEAAAIGEKILAAQPDHPAGLFLKGEGLYAKKNYDGAVKAYREAVSLDPAPQFLDGLGRANEKLEQFEDAVRAYEKANEQEPAYLNPLLGRARIRLSRRQFDMALDVLKAAREQAPNEPRIYYMLGVCYHETGKEKNAIANLAKAIKLDPTLGAAHYRLGLAYIDAGKERDAIRALKAATTNGDDDTEWLTDAYYKLGFVARHSDKASALKAYQDFLARDPKNKAEKKEAKTWIMRLKAQLGR